MEEHHALALELAKGQKPSPKAIERVALKAGGDAARWAFTQWELRGIATSKFEDPCEMLFVREALEQATRNDIAKYHASRFPTGELAADLTCGIGADLLALAARGPAVGYEIDPERATCARHNLACNGLAAEVREEDSLTAAWPDYVFADPARRVEGKRVIDPTSFTPDPIELAERMSHLKLGGLKLTPLLQDSLLTRLGPELAFVASGDECPEVVVWCGSEASAERYAVFADTAERLATGESPLWNEHLGEMLYEAHPAAIRAHGLGVLCDQFGLKGLCDSNGYLTGGRVAPSRWLKPYEVISGGKGDIRAVRDELKRLGSKTPIIKSRAGIDVEGLRRDLKMEGDRTLIVAAYAIAKSIRYAILTEA